MSRSSSPQTTTTTSQPPAYALPHLTAATDAAGRMFRGGGTPVVPFADETNEALWRTTNRALSGSAVTNAAQDYATNTLSGGMMGQNPFLSGGENPHLDAMFQRGAGEIANQVQTHFTRAGRNDPSSAAGVAADRMGDFAAQLYGGAYENDANRRLSAYQGERNLQQGLVPFAGQLASQDYADLGQLANVGAQREALAREQYGQQGRALDEYLARVSGLPGGIVSQSVPQERNLLGSALSGAMMGSAFGPWGMLGGGLGGLILGGL